VITTIAEGHVPAMLAAFDLGSSGRLSEGPVASGRLGSIWRLDTNDGTWAVKQVGDVSSDALAEILEGAAFQEAAFAAGIATPGGGGRRPASSSPMRAACASGSMRGWTSSSPT
jgi:hypothetical protein